MGGRVIGLNGVLCAVEVDSGITIFEILSEHSTEIDDRISGELESVGKVSLINQSKEETIEVFVENWGCNRIHAQTYLSG